MSNQKTKEPLLLAIYNHKGGVGKTTSTHNIGVALSKLGLRVLLVDADPQYNLTGIIFAEKFDLKEDGKCEIDEFYQLAEQKAEEAEPTYLTLGTLFSKLSKMPPSNLSDAKRVQLTPVHEYKNLLFLPGFWTIKDVDEIVARGLHNQTYMENIPGYITNILREIGRENSIDIILVDMSPSSNCFDGALFCGCDYFLTPFGHDFYSYQSMKSMKSTLVSWMKKLHNKNREEERSGFGLVNTKPKFLGAFPQRIKTRTLHGVENIEQAISAWIDRIYNECQDLSETLRMEEMVSSQFKFKRVLGVYEFNSAGLNAQSSGRPICDISFNHTHEHNGKVRNFNAEERKKKLKVFDCYLNIIAELFSNMEKADLLKLGYFKLLCQQHSNMLFDHQVSYLPEKPMTPIMTMDPQDEEEDNNTRWYSDFDIMSLVNHYIEEEEHTDAFVFYPVTAGNRFNKEDGSKYLDAALEKCKEELDDGNCTVALAPLLINDNHWVVVTISKIKDDDLYQISVYDPMSNNGKIPSFLASSFNIFEEKSIIPTTAGGQDDGHSCGVWVVEYIRSFINPAHDMPAPGTSEIHNRRRAHQNVMRGLANTHSHSIIPALKQKKETKLMDDFVTPKSKKETKKNNNNKKSTSKRKNESTSEETEEDPACSASNDSKESKKKKRKNK